MELDSQQCQVLIGIIKVGQRLQDRRTGGQGHLRHGLQGTPPFYSQAADKKTGLAVAIKRVFQDPKYKNRELDILKELNHENCVRMIKYFFNNGKAKDEVYLNIVMDFVKENLSRLIRYFKVTVRLSYLYLLYIPCLYYPPSFIQRLLAKAEIPRYSGQDLRLPDAARTVLLALPEHFAP